MSVQYKNMDNNEIVRITSENDKFYTLNNGTNIVKELFIKKYTPVMDNYNQPVIETTNVNETRTQFTPTATVDTYHSQAVIDPLDFLHGTKMSVDGLDSIQKVDTSRVVDMPAEMARQVKINDPNGVMVDESALAEKKKILMDEYNRNAALKGAQPIVNDDVDEFLAQGRPKKVEKVVNDNGLTDEQEVMRQNEIALTGVDPFADRIKKYKEKNNKKPAAKPVYDSNVNNEPEPYYRPEYQEAVDESTKIFKSFKRNYEIKLKFSVKEKISKPEFIKIMADGLEGDIIEYYSNEIFKNFISDTDGLKKEIYNQIYKEVYGEEFGAEEVKPTKVSKPKKTTKPTLPASQIIKEGKDPVKSEPKTKKIKKNEVK